MAARRMARSERDAQKAGHALTHSAARRALPPLRAAGKDHDALAPAEAADIRRCRRGALAAYLDALSGDAEYRLPYKGDELSDEGILLTGRRGG